MDSYGSLPPPQPVHGGIALRGLLQQRIAGLLREPLKVLQGAGVGSGNAQYLPACQCHQCLFGLQNGQRAVQAAGVQFRIKGQGIVFFHHSRHRSQAENTPVER